MRPPTGDRALVMAIWVFVAGNAGLLTIGSLALASGPSDPTELTEGCAEAVRVDASSAQGPP